MSYPPRENRDLRDDCPPYTRKMYIILQQLVPRTQICHKFVADIFNV